MPREIISLQAGQAGNQSKYNRTIRREVFVKLTLLFQWIGYNSRFRGEHDTHIAVPRLATTTD
jgi:hypothetical protein